MCVPPQGSEGAGHIEAAHLESSGMSWKLPLLGAVGNLEEQGIRIPPLSAGCCFNDEYEVPATHLTFFLLLSQEEFFISLFLASTRAAAHCDQGRMIHVLN